MNTSPAKRFTKRPVTIEAIQFLDTHENLCDLSEFMPDPLVVDYAFPNDPLLNIETLEGVMSAKVGDWVIKGLKGEFYPCKPDIFEASYIPAE